MLETAAEAKHAAEAVFESQAVFEFLLKQFLNSCTQDDSC